MAIGDAAAARGMALVSGSELRNTIDTLLNQTRDYIDQYTRWAAIQGKPATFPPSAHSHSWDQVTGKPSTFAPATHSHSWDSITSKPSSFTPSSHNHDDRYYTKSEVNAKTWSGSDITSGTITRPVSTSGGGRFGAAWDNNITSTRRAVWMESDGTLGHTASSARYKKNITPWDALSDEAFLQLVVVTFQWRNGVDPSDHIEIGMIAEELHDRGLAWAVFYEPDGFGVLRPEGIHYDRLVLAVIPVVQRLITRVTSIEERLTALEAAA